MLSLFALTLRPVTAHADAPAFISAGEASVAPPVFTGTFGWSFIHIGPNSLISITRLGVFDSGGDGLVNFHPVGLWGNDGTLLASIIVPQGTAAPLVGGFRYVDITPVILPLNGIAIVGAQYSAGDADNVDRPSLAGFAPDITFFNLPFQSAGRFGVGPNLQFPDMVSTIPCGQLCPGPAFLEASFRFDVVPEPSLWLLAFPGALCVFSRFRSRRRRYGQ